MPVKIYCNLCAGEIKGRVVKVAAYAKPVSQDADRFLQGAGETEELGTAFAHPECARALGAGIVEAFSDAADALSKPPREGVKEEPRDRERRT